MMKEELRSSVAKTALVLSIISFTLTFFDVAKVILFIQLVLSFISIILTILIIRKYKKTATVTLILNICSLLIGLVFLWMYFLK